MPMSMLLLAMERLYETMVGGSTIVAPRSIRSSLMYRPPKTVAPFNVPFPQSSLARCHRYDSRPAVVETAAHPRAPRVPM